MEPTMSKPNIEHLNENERKALDAIAKTCDELDGDLFTRMADAVMAVMKEFDFNGHVAGGYIAALIKKGFLDEESDDGYGIGLWVNI